MRFFTTLLAYLVVFVLIVSSLAEAAGTKRHEASTWVRVKAKRKHHFSLRWRIVKTALHFRGVRYVWGGSTPRGFDCSGFVRYVFHRVGISLPRTTWGMMSRGWRVSRAGMRAGDAVFFYHGSHVGLYIGRGLFMDANHSGGSVNTRRLSAYPAPVAIRRYR